jgi:hypothetical protein
MALKLTHYPPPCAGSSPCCGGKGSEVARAAQRRTIVPMRRVVLALLLLLLLGSGCSSNAPEFEDSGTGRIRGTFTLGSQMLRHGWVEMIELTGVGKRCRPGDCGLAVELLSVGEEWNPGVWRVVAPPVQGWNPPDPFEIVVEPDRLTRFEAEYEPSQSPEP